eukprot:3220260-Amphidinium_carterae.1
MGSTGVWGDYAWLTVGVKSDSGAKPASVDPTTLSCTESQHLGDASTHAIVVKVGHEARAAISAPPTEIKGVPGPQTSNDKK